MVVAVIREYVYNSGAFLRRAGAQKSNLGTAAVCSAAAAAVGGGLSRRSLPRATHKS